MFKASCCEYGNEFVGSSTVATSDYQLHKKIFSAWSQLLRNIELSISKSVICHFFDDAQFKVRKSDMKIGNFF